MLKKFKISTADHLTIRCAQDLFATVSEGVIYSVCKIVAQSSFGIISNIRRVEVYGHFATVSKVHIRASHTDGS